VLIQRLLYQHAIVDTRILTTEYWFWTADLPLITNTESGRSGYSWIVRSLRIKLENGLFSPPLPSLMPQGNH